jgi:hypothetical protein
MAAKLCLRCDWTGRTRSDTCPRCGALLFDRAGGEPAPPRERSWRGWVATGLVVLIAVAAFVTIQRFRPSAPAATTGLEGYLVYPAPEGDQVRLWIWNLSTDTIEPGPLVPTTPSSLVSVYSVEDSWLGLTMPTGSHGEAAEVLRSADPNAQLATLGRGAFVAWQEGGAFVSFARTQHVQGCDERLIVSTMSVADRIGRHTRPFLLCQKVVGLLRDSLSPYAVTVLPDHDRQVSRVFSDAMAPILTGYEPLGVSQNGDFLVRSSRGQAGMYYPSANPERNTPSMIVLHGNPLLVSRLLAWSTDGNIAYVLGSIGGVEGVFAITVGPRQEPGAPVLVVRTSDAEVVAASTVTNDLYVVAEGTVRFVHDGEVTAVLSPPPGAPGVSGPLLWVLSLPYSPSVTP